MSDAYLVVVDMQTDFVTGALGTAQAQAIRRRVLQKVQSFDGTVVFTQDTHTKDYLQTQEGKVLPVAHCIRGTDGWQLLPELAAFCKEQNCRIFEKPTFGSMQLADFLQSAYQNGLLRSVELIGVCTDICVVSNALLLKAMLPELPIAVDAACCAGVTAEKHEAALDTMESCQILVKNR